MDKIAFLYLSRLIKKFVTSDSVELFDNIHAVSAWLSESVSVIGRLGSFTIVQDELMSLADFIVQGKHVTPRVCLKLITLLKQMQKEILDKFEIVVFVTKSISLNFNKNVKIIRIEDENECIELAYSLKKELKYLVLNNNDSVNVELLNAMDIVIKFEELVELADKCYPIDKHSYDRMYLTSKLNKLKKRQSNIFITGSNHAIIMSLGENAINVCMNNQDLYYSLLSVKEVLKYSNEIDTIIISFPYYFWFSDITANFSEHSVSFLNRVFYPIYNTLGKYKGETPPLYIKDREYPVYEAIINLESVRDIYHNAIIKDLEDMEYYNEINKLEESYKSDSEENIRVCNLRAKEHNELFDLDREMENRRLFDAFLENMEELGKKVILVVPPVTKKYSELISKEIIGVSQKSLEDMKIKYSGFKYVDLFNSDEFDESDFFDCELLNSKGGKKLSSIISKLS